MEIKDFVSLLFRKKQTVFSIVFVLFSIAAILTFIQPFKYSTEAKIMLVQEFPEGTDPYTMAKSNEFLSGLLSQVVVSNSFFDTVMSSGFNISADYFAGSNKKMMEKWAETVEAQPLEDTGIIHIEVFHPDKYQAEQIVRAINFTLENRHTDYHSGSKNLQVKVIDKPIVSDFPVKPNIPLNFALSLALGFVISLCYVYLFPDEKYNIRIWPRFGKKKIIAEREIVYPVQVDIAVSDVVATEEIPTVDDSLVIPVAPTNKSVSFWKKNNKKNWKAMAKKKEAERIGIRFEGDMKNIL